MSQQYTLDNTEPLSHSCNVDATGSEQFPNIYTCLSYPQGVVTYGDNWNLEVFKTPSPLGTYIFSEDTVTLAIQPKRLFKRRKLSTLEKYLVKNDDDFFLY